MFERDVPSRYNLNLVDVSMVITLNRTHSIATSPMLWYSDYKRIFHSFLFVGALFYVVYKWVLAFQSSFPMHLLNAICASTDSLDSILVKNRILHLAQNLLPQENFINLRRHAPSAKRDIICTQISSHHHLHETLYHLQKMGKHNLFNTSKSHDYSRPA